LEKIKRIIKLLIILGVLYLAYNAFIKEHFLNSSYTGSLAIFEEWFKNINEKSLSYEIYNTLRMCVNEE